MCDDLLDCFFSLLGLFLLVIGPTLLVYLIWLKITV